MSTEHVDPVTSLLLGISIILLAAKFGGDLMMRMRQPAVLGELMVGVVLDRSTPESFAAFEGAVMDMKEVLDCNLVAGDFDYLLKIRVRDMADFNKLHGQKLIALPGVRQTRTFFVMKEVKESARLPF